MKYALFILITFLIAIRYFLTRPSYKNGQKIRITQRVSSEPIRYETTQRIVLSGLTVYLPLYPEISYGDKVVVEGVVDEKKLSSATLVKTEEAKGSLFRLRKRLLEVFERSLPQPHSALVSGMVLGSKSSLTSSFWEGLKDTGTAHVVVASGMNVSLVASFLMAILVLMLPRRKAIPAALLGIWGYSAISGFDAPIVRAAIMGSLAFVGQALGKLYLAWRALVISALLMLVVRPEWLTDLGFILSFVATGFLILFERKIANLIHFVPSFLRQGLSTSSAAQIGVSPILFVTFGQFNLLSPLINALVLWTVAPITIIGFIGGFLGLISINLGKIILFSSYPFTTWFVWVVDLFS